LTEASSGISPCDPDLVADLRARATPEEWIPVETRQSSFFETLAPPGLEVNSPSLPAKTDDELTADMNAALASGDLATVVETLGSIAKARGMSQVARDAGLARESLYRSLNGGGNPEFSTVMKVMSSVGLRLTVSKGSSKDLS
jgi:adenine-specific DNA-methyltransferase